MTAASATFIPCHEVLFTNISRFFVSFVHSRAALCPMRDAPRRELADVAWRER